MISNPKENLRKPFQLLILLHKFDPDIKNRIDIIENQRYLESQIIKIIGKLKFSIYKTSIYDIATLLRAFSEGVFYATQKSKMFQALLKYYMGKTFKGNPKFVLDLVFREVEWIFNEDDYRRLQTLGEVVWGKREPIPSEEFD